MNAIKAGIDRPQKENKCRRCGQPDETVNHILTERPKLAQKECKQ